MKEIMRVFESPTEFALRILRNETIDLCAQIADKAAFKAVSEYDKGKYRKHQKHEYLWCSDEAAEIAATIRKLKDE